MGDGLTVECHQVIILESRRFCFQQLLDFDEFVEEIFYSFDVFHGANIQPDLQWIINPGGYHSATNIWVFGIQLSVPL